MPLDRSRGSQLDGPAVVSPGPAPRWCSRGHRVTGRPVGRPFAARLDCCCCLRIRILHPVPNCQREVLALALALALVLVLALVLGHGSPVNWGERRRRRCGWRIGLLRRAGRSCRLAAAMPWGRAKARRWEAQSPADKVKVLRRRSISWFGNSMAMCSVPRSSSPPPEGNATVRRQGDGI